jgi:DNA-binding transcriptional regulator YdaS (Cro superfamily)
MDPVAMAGPVNFLEGFVLNKTMVALSSALALMVATAPPALAQDGTGTGNGPASSQNAITAPTSRVTPSRVERQRQNRGQQKAAPAAADPAVIKAEVEALFVAGSTACQVTDAKLLGVSAEQVKIYEAACAGAPGYIVVASTPPQIVDCVVLDSQAKSARAANPEATTGPICALPANQDIQGFLKAYATQAGVPCTVDEAKVRGQASEGGIVYEIGCAGADGYWIDKNATGWEKTECLQVVSQNGGCAFTTPAEQVATVKSWLAGTDAATCDVQQVRLMGQNANGRFVEMTCAGADGFIIRQNAEHAVQQAYPCATAQQIGGGCKLTTTAPAATPQA